MGASGASERVQLNTELRQTASNGLTSPHIRLKYALEMTNSQACWNRELIYYMQYEVAVFSFPGVSFASE